MLDRLSLSLVTLPVSTYDSVLILTDADDTRTESRRLLSRDVLARIVSALKPGGRLRSQDGTFASVDTEERREAILAGLVVSDHHGASKPDYDSTQSIPLKFGKAKSEGGSSSTTTAAGTGAVSLNLNSKQKNGPAGVGFVDGSTMGDSDDELIDEDELLDESDLARPIVQRSFRSLLTHSLVN